MLDLMRMPFEITWTSRRMRLEERSRHLKRRLHNPPPPPSPRDHSQEAFDEVSKRVDHLAFEVEEMMRNQEVLIQDLGEHFCCPLQTNPTIPHCLDSCHKTRCSRKKMMKTKLLFILVFLVLYRSFGDDKGGECMYCMD